MLHPKNSFLFILAVLMAFVAVGCTSAGKPQQENPPAMEAPAELQEQYPTFFNLDAGNGLTVYVAKVAQNQIICSVYSTVEEEADFNKIALAPKTDPATMKQILTCYSLSPEKITVVPYYSPYSSYIAPDLFEEKGMAELLFELGLGEKPEGIVDDTNDSPYPYTICWADYSEDGERAIRFTYYPITDTFDYQNELTYPAVGIKNRQDLDSFISLAKYYFSLNASMPDAITFNSLVKAYDEAFFQEKGLVIVYIPSESNSIGYGLADATVSGEELHLTVAEKRPEGEPAQQMAGWFMVVEMEQSVLSQANYFTAGK